MSGSRKNRNQKGTVTLRKRLIEILPLVLAAMIAGCGDTQQTPDGSSTSVTANEALSAESTSSSASASAEVNSPADTADASVASNTSKEIPDPDKMFTISFADESACEGAIFSQPDSNGYAQYVITAGFAPSFFSLREVIGDENANMTPGDILFETSDMKAGDYIYLTDVIPEGIPSRMIEWADGNGQTYSRAISESGKDGSLLLIDMDPEESHLTDVPALPAYIYPGGDPVLAAVTSYMADVMTGYYSDYDVSIPAPVILKQEKIDDTHIKVYGNFWIFNYDLQGQTLENVSGGEAPGYMIVTRDGDSMKVTDAEFAGDGAEYAEDIKNFCGDDKSLESQYFASNDAGQEPLLSVRKEFIHDYVEANGLDITAYQDYGWEPVGLSD